MHQGNHFKVGTYLNHRMYSSILSPQLCTYTFLSVIIIIFGANTLTKNQKCYNQKTAIAMHLRHVRALTIQFATSSHGHKNYYILWGQQTALHIPLIFGHHSLWKTCICVPTPPLSARSLPDNARCPMLAASPPHTAATHSAICCNEL